MPAYNEAKLIRGALEGIPSFVDHIIVVDDGSDDATTKIALAHRRPIELIEHDTNQGVGDGQMDPGDLPALLAPLIAGEADYAKGNRLGWPAASRAMPWHRWLGNHLFSWMTRLALGVDTQDSQCGYTAMNQRAKRALEWDRLWKSYGYPNDLLGWLKLRGLRVRDVPVRPVYGAEQSGIRLRHVMCIIPFVIARAWLRSRAHRRELAPHQPRPT
jgi:glycosyltransferase involved in cell wall biosynthesis